MSDIRALHVMGTDLRMLGEITNFKSLRIKRAFREVGDFQLVMNKRSKAAELLQRDRLLFPVGEPEKCVIIESVQEAEGKDLLTLTGWQLKGIVKRRICLPPNDSSLEYRGFGYDRISGPAETVLKHYLQNNITAPESTARRIPEFFLEEDQGRGMANVPWSARFEELEAILKEICTYCDCGYDAVPDFATGRCMLRFLPGRDRTVPGNRIVFSSQMGNVADTTFTEDAKTYKNVAIVAGAGEDENRLVLIYAPTGETGMDRREMIVEAGSKDLTNGLDEEGPHKLANKPLKQTFKASILDTKSIRYGEDWDLGDLVTLVTGSRRIVARITAVQETYEANKAPKYEVTFGDPVDSIETVIKTRTQIVVR